MNTITVTNKDKKTSTFEWRLIKKDEEMLLSQAESLCTEGGWEVANKEHLEAFKPHCPEEEKNNPIVAIGPTYGVGMNDPWFLKEGDIVFTKMQYWVAPLGPQCRYLSVRKVA